MESKQKGHAKMERYIDRVIQAEKREGEKTTGDEGKMKLICFLKEPLEGKRG